MKDTNFNDLTQHFQKRIYGSHKGRIRLAVLQRDLEQNITGFKDGGLSVLDVGAGLGQMGLKFAQYGHQLCINDISENMLNIAKESAQVLGIRDDILWQQGAFQDLPDKPYDVVLCHAVLEWLHKPEQLIEKLIHLTHKKSVVSLMFYNRDALLFHNLIRGNFNKIKNNDFSGMKGGLTPQNPVKPAWVQAKLEEVGFEVIYKSGVRVFSDYVGVKRGGNACEEDVLQMELLYSNQEPYIQMGRYIHFICQQPTFRLPLV